MVRTAAVRTVVAPIVLDGTQRQAFDSFWISDTQEGSLSFSDAARPDSRHVGRGKHSIGRKHVHPVSVSDHAAHGRRRAAGRAALTIDNVDRAIITSLRNIGATPATLLIEIVTSNTPDTVEFSSGNLTLRTCRATPYR